MANWDEDDTWCSHGVERSKICKACADYFRELPSRAAELAAMRAPDLTPAGLLQRIKLARTPSIATDDAYTVAKLHDVVIEYVVAKQRHLATVERWRARRLYGQPMPVAGREEIASTRASLDAAYAALEVVAGIEP